MYRSSLLVALFAVLAFTGKSRAQDSSNSLPSSTENSVKIEDINPEKNKATGDVDSLISNNELRAISGSKSKYSIATAFAYYGGSVQEPLGQWRPNLTGGNGVTAVAQFTGDINGKYNFDQTHSLLLGVGMRWISPLYGNSTPANYNGTKVDLDNETLNYQYVYKSGGVQNILQVGPELYTNANMTQVGYVAGVNLSQTSMYEIGHSGFTIGLAAGLGGNTFNKNGGVIPNSNGATYLSQQTDYLVQLAPILEYQLNKRLNLRTLIEAQYEHHRDMPGTNFVSDKVYQSFGVGISVTRDIFLYPNIQFIPDELRASQTNVALASYINVF